LPEAGWETTPIFAVTTIVVYWLAPRNRQANKGFGGQQFAVTLAFTRVYGAIFCNQFVLEE
jgi:hypothetical protein